MQVIHISRNKYKNISKRHIVLKNIIKHIFKHANSQIQYFHLGWFHPRLIIKNKACKFVSLI